VGKALKDTVDVGQHVWKSVYSVKSIVVKPQTIFGKAANAASKSTIQAILKRAEWVPQEIKKPEPPHEIGKN